MTVVNQLLGYGITLFFLLIMANVFLQDVFQALGAGESLIFSIMVLGMIYIGLL